MIIEDDDSIRESLDMYLTEEGYGVEGADSGGRVSANLVQPMWNLLSLMSIFPT